MQLSLTKLGKAEIKTKVKVLANAHCPFKKGQLDDSMFTKNLETSFSSFLMLRSLFVKFRHFHDGRYCFKQLTVGNQEAKNVMVSYTVAALTFHDQRSFSVSCRQVAYT